MGAYDEPILECPYCESDMEADWVDVGVGSVQCGPYHCMNCGASEIGPELYDWCYQDRKGETIYLDSPKVYSELLGKKHRSWDSKYVLRYNAPFTEEELNTGYYRGGKLSPYANTVNGELVDHITAKDMYNIGLLDEKR